MSWREAVEAPGITVLPSPYETARFGVDIERAVVSARSRATEDDLVEAVRSSAADVVIVRYPADRMGWFATLADQGRVALLADTLVYWRLTAGTGRRAPRPESTDLIPVSDTAGGNAITEALIGEIFTGYRNHYLANPLFDHDRVRAGYQEWACRSLAFGRSVMMCERDHHDGHLQGDGRPRVDGSRVDGPRDDGPRDDGPRDDGERNGGERHRGDRPRVAASVPIGMSVGAADAGCGLVEILLAGVVPHAQGRGMYPHLLAVMEDWALDEGAESVVISTQGHNTRVQRAWTRYGFEPVHSLVTAHLVRPELLADGARRRTR